MNEKGETTYLEQLKEIQSAFIPILESNRISYAFYIGRLCWYLMQELHKEDETMGIDELLTDCQEELEISRNLINNTSLFYSWCLDNGMIIDTELNLDILYSYWERLQGGQVTLPKIYRLILPKTEPKQKNAKIEGIKKSVGKYLSEANYASIELTKDGKMVYELKEGL